MAGEDSHFSFGRALRTCIAIFGAMLLIFLLYIGPSNVPFGVQIETTIWYTGAMFLFIFCRTRGFDTGFSLQDEGVKEKLPRLLAIHAVFLASGLSIQTVASAARPHLSAYWFTRHSRDTLFDDVQVLTYVLIGMAQVLISRGILSRSMQAHKAKDGVSHAQESQK